MCNINVGKIYQDWFMFWRHCTLESNGHALLYCITDPVAQALSDPMLAPFSGKGSII
jgi:hypothetical protein